MSKKTPFLLSHFPTVVFIFENLNLCYTVLKANFKLITVTNYNYSSSSYKDIKKLRRFYIKTYSQHWLRINFKGKGYRLRKFKNYNKLTLNFGHSHWAKVSLDPESFCFWKVRRQNYLCCIKSYQLLKDIKFGFKFFKKLNSYTKRGLRLKKQLIKKRFGKISQVVSSLH